MSSKQQDLRDKYLDNYDEDSHSYSSEYDGQDRSDDLNRQAYEREIAERDDDARLQQDIDDAQEYHEGRTRLMSMGVLLPSDDPTLPEIRKMLGYLG